MTGQDGVVVICAALEVEFTAVRAQLNGPIRRQEIRGSCYEVGHCAGPRDTWTVVLALTGQGNAAAAVHVDRAISAFSPQVVLFVGVAGGRKDVRLGDVVIAESIYDYDSGKDTESDYLPRTRAVRPTFRILQHAAAIARDACWHHRVSPPPSTEPAAIVKPLATGGKVIAHDRSHTARLVDRYCGDAVAVEMEGHGFLHGATMTGGVEALVIRGISDLLNDKSEASDRYWQPQAASHAAAFAVELLAGFTALPEPPVAVTVPRQLPPLLRDFTGRQQQLAELDRLLDESADAVMISAVDGTAGVGKTALAVQWAHGVQQFFPGGTLFVNLRGYGPTAPLDPRLALAGFLTALGVPAAQIPADQDALTGLYRTTLADRRVLILLDNAGSAEQVRPLLPSAPGCLVLITSRSTLTGLTVADGVGRLPLGLLSDLDSRQLLHRIIGADRLATEPGAVTDLIGACSRLPLALRIAAARIATRRFLTVADVVREIRTNERGVDALNTADDERTTVRAVFDWSYTKLSPEPARTFRLLGLHPGPEFGVLAVSALTGLDEEGAYRHLEILADLNLLEIIGHRRYRFHDLLHDYARTRCAAECRPPEITSARTAVLTWYAHTAWLADGLAFPSYPCLPWEPAIPPSPLPELTDRSTAFGWFGLERPNLVQAHQEAWQHGLSYLVTILAAGCRFLFLRERTQRTVLADLSFRGVQAARRTGAAHSEALLLAFLAEALASVDRVEEARIHFTRLRELATRIEDPLTLSLALLGLGSLSRGEMDYRRARELYEAAAPVAERTGDLRQQAVVFSCLSTIHTHLGEYRTALGYAQRHLDLRQRCGDPLGEAHAWYISAMATQGLGEHENALRLAEQSIALHRTLDGSEPELALALDCAATSLQQLGHAARAAEHLREAAELFERLGDPAATTARLRVKHLEAGPQAARSPQAGQPGHG
ncbi:hypothetical protein D5S17_01945 [Pseudonocardiaceae bacterium YIM PH 21723]|nr:hypothetical protein D5S17_01945 [Pseudonocardiaceae bacterium YIM PH 21723]